VAGSCEEGNEPPTFTKGEFIYYLSDY